MSTGGADLLLFMERCGCCSWYRKTEGGDFMGVRLDYCRYYKRSVYDVLDCDLRGRPLVKRPPSKDQKDLSRFGVPGA